MKKLNDLLKVTLLKVTLQIRSRPGLRVRASESMPLAFYLWIFIKIQNQNQQLLSLP